MEFTQIPSGAAQRDAVRWERARGTLGVRFLQTFASLQLTSIVPEGCGQSRGAGARRRGTEAALLRVAQRSSTTRALQPLWTWGPRPPTLKPSRGVQGLHGQARAVRRGLRALHGQAPSDREGRAVAKWLIC